MSMLKKLLCFSFYFSESFQHKLVFQDQLTCSFVNSLKTVYKSVQSYKVSFSVNQITWLCKFLGALMIQPKDEVSSSQRWFLELACDFRVLESHTLQRITKAKNLIIRFLEHRISNFV